MTESTERAVAEAINDGCVISRTDRMDDGEMRRYGDILIMGTARPWRAEARNIVRIGLAAAFPWLRVPHVALPTDYVLDSLRERRNREVEFIDGPAAGEVMMVEEPRRGVFMYAPDPHLSIYAQPDSPVFATEPHRIITYRVEKYGTRDDFRLRARVDHE